MPAIKAISAVAALLGGAATVIVGAWLSTAGLGWIAANREIVAISQPMLPAFVLGLLIIGTVRQRRFKR